MWGYVSAVTSAVTSMPGYLGFGQRSAGAFEATKFDRSWDLSRLVKESGKSVVELLAVLPSSPSVDAGFVTLDLGTPKAQGIFDAVLRGLDAGIYKPSDVYRLNIDGLKQAAAKFSGEYVAYAEMSRVGKPLSQSDYVNDRLLTESLRGFIERKIGDGWISLGGTVRRDADVAAPDMVAASAP